MGYQSQVVPALPHHQVSPTAAKTKPMMRTEVWKLCMMKQKLDLENTNFDNYFCFKYLKVNPITSFLFMWYSDIYKGLVFVTKCQHFQMHAISNERLSEILLASDFPKFSFWHFCCWNSRNTEHCLYSLHRSFN